MLPTPVFADRPRRRPAACAVPDAASPARRLWRRLRRAWRAYWAAEELMALDDRLLRDIGLRREQIPNAVRGAPIEGPRDGRTPPRPVPLRPGADRRATGR